MSDYNESEFEYTPRPDKIFIEWLGYLFDPKHLFTVELIEEDFPILRDENDNTAYLVVFNRQVAENSVIHNKRFSFHSLANREHHLKVLRQKFAELSVNGYNIKIL